MIDLTSGARVVFNDPRRFGVMDLVDAGSLGNALALGPEPLDPEFDASVLARAWRGRRMPMKAPLLDQRVVAGLGNIYASEALHRARLSPRRPASTICDAVGLASAGCHGWSQRSNRRSSPRIERVPGPRVS